MVAKDTLLGVAKRPGKLCKDGVGYSHNIRENIAAHTKLNTSCPDQAAKPDDYYYANCRNNLLRISEHKLAICMLLRAWQPLYTDMDRKHCMSEH